MAGSICNSAGRYFAEMGKLLERVDHAAIDRFGGLLYDAWRDRRRVFFFGNGGSAATASHIVCDLMKTAGVEGKPRLKALSLTDNVGMMTALGNDVCYDEIFIYPLSAYAQPGDLAVGVSCSGSSPNVLRAAQWAGENGLTNVALTGLGGGKLKDLADLHINIPSDNYGLIEDLHLSVGHIVAQMLKSRIMSEGAVPSCNC